MRFVPKSHSARTALPAALLLALETGHAAAASLSCEPWSVAGYQEHGPITIRISDSELSWSNGTTVRAVPKIADGVYSDGHTVIIVYGSSTYTFVRRVPFAENAPLSSTRCTALP